MSDGKEIQKWADDFMFEAQEIDATRGPEVWLLACNPDPLGSIAAAAKAYKGEFVTSLAEITDQERKHYLAEIQKTALAMPLESVHFHFRISGVTRGFTHQMVRQRTAAYSQESTRFAVKTGVPVGLPPSLVGTTDELREIRDDIRKRYPEWKDVPAYVVAETGAWDKREAADREWQFRSERVAKENRWRGQWDAVMRHIEEAYNQLVNDGMPAEDARGMLPTNLLTQLNYFTNLRNYKDEAGKRLCTQAQFEWRIVFSKMVEAIREFGKTQSYTHTLKGSDGYEEVRMGPSLWQFNAIADLFRPDCYYKGRCTFKADFDRKCSIRSRVDANAEINRPSSKWHDEHDQVPAEQIVVGFDGSQIVRTELGMPAFIPAIRPEEWLLDPGAAR